MKEEIIYVVDSLGVSHPETIEKAKEPITTLFAEGGLPGMIAITLLLIALFVAAWKAPRWVKEIGIGALVVSIFWTLRGLFQIMDIIQLHGDIPFSVICGGVKVALISTLYGLIVYFISLIIRITHKTRI
ncbi:MAG: MotA/TolQ/ExbB proton channel family protein [Bacteroidales bacterium]|nr:MotA/TolQ/ExbB proton channel family protein [Bacteroidales bacterium]